MSDDRAYAPPAEFVRLRLLVQWDGRDFVGWQSQAAGRSVQDTLHAALERFAVAHRPVAAGRTDAGVHALAMPVHVDVRAPLRVPPERLARALNGALPRDLVVVSAAPAPAGFHARFSCRSRRYLYRVWRAAYRSPLEEGRAWHVPTSLDVPAMREAGALLLGRHDFAAFATREERQTVRELLELRLAEAGEVLELHVSGESFLRHMVRALVGTLVLVGQGRLAPGDVREILSRGERRLAGKNAPPHGLYFMGAEY